MNEIDTNGGMGHPIYPMKFEYVRIWLEKPQPQQQLLQRRLEEKRPCAPQKNSNYDPGEYTGSPGQRKFRSK
ncbi:hypothetical protein V9T40_006108 [Parthenolecanium corni]|uniref:Uncharacterized protein n=1 Tax=Parthenolecanium corni TaxID=536013 RepID=A0AAN9YBA7_9HEMI